MKKIFFMSLFKKHGFLDIFIHATIWYLLPRPMMKGDTNTVHTYSTFVDFCGHLFL
jgi:hypothetical protein